MSTTESATTVELPRERQEVGVRRRDHDRVLAGRHGRRASGARVSLRYVTPAWSSRTARSVARSPVAITAPARELLERDVPQPRRIAAVGPARVDRDHDRAAARRAAGRRSRRASRPIRPGSSRAAGSRRGRRRDGARTGPRPRARRPTASSAASVGTPSAPRRADRHRDVAAVGAARAARATYGYSTPATRSHGPRRSIVGSGRASAHSGHDHDGRGARQERAARRARGRVAVPLGSARDPGDVGRARSRPTRRADRRRWPRRCTSGMRGERVAPAQREHAGLGVAVELVAAQVQQRGDRIGARRRARRAGTTRRPRAPTGPVPGRRRAACSTHPAGRLAPSRLVATPSPSAAATSAVVVVLPLVPETRHTVPIGEQRREQVGRDPQRDVAGEHARPAAAHARRELRAARRRSARAGREPPPTRGTRCGGGCVGCGRASRA